MKLEPAKYTRFFSADKNIFSAEGSGALATGVTPSSQGYFVHGWFKFGGVEICKTRFAMGMSEQDARKNRDSNTLGGSAVTEVFLCPFEACRVRSVSEPSNANGMLANGQKMVTENGVVNGFQQKMAETIYLNLGTSPPEPSKGAVQTVSLGSDLATGVAAPTATIPHTIDGILSEVNQKGATGEDSIMVQSGRIAGACDCFNFVTATLLSKFVCLD